MAFGKIQGFHSTLPSEHCPRMGPCPGQSERPVSCLTVWQEPDSGKNVQLHKRGCKASDTQHASPQSSPQGLQRRASLVPQKHRYF